MERAELDLGQLTMLPTFVGADEGPIKKSNMASKYSKEKITVAANYQFFIYRVLQKNIRSLNLRGVEVYKRTFIETGIAICYFRIPEFMTYMNEGFQAPSEATIEHGLNESVDSVNTDDLNLAATTLAKSNITKRNEGVSHHFDWRKYLYDLIPEE